MRRSCADWVTTAPNKTQSNPDPDPETLCSRRSRPARPNNENWYWKLREISKTPSAGNIPRLPLFISPSLDFEYDFDCVLPSCCCYLFQFRLPPPPTSLKAARSLRIWKAAPLFLSLSLSLFLSLPLDVCCALAIAIRGHITNASPTANVVTLCCCCTLHVACCTVRLRLHNLVRSLVPSLSIIMSTRWMRMSIKMKCRWYVGCGRRVSFMPWTTSTRSILLLSLPAPFQHQNKCLPGHPGHPGQLKQFPKRPFRLCCQTFATCFIRHISFCGNFL